jgi:hypothetical protein
LGGQLGVDFWRRSRRKARRSAISNEGSEGRIGFLTIGVGVVVAAIGVAVVVGVLVAGGRAVVAAVVGVALLFVGVRICGYLG